MEASLAPLNELLEDAKTVAVYGQRSGKLRSPDLFDAISSFESQAERGWMRSETIELQKALNRAIGDIAPASLIDIRARNPFRTLTDMERMRDTRKKISLAVVSLIIIALTGYYSVMYSRGLFIMAQLREITAADPLKVIGRVARKTQGGPLSGTGLVEYQTMLDDLRALDARVAAVYYGAARYRDRIRWPFYEDDLRRFSASADPYNRSPQFANCPTPAAANSATEQTSTGQSGAPGATLADATAANQDPAAKPENGGKQNSGTASIPSSTFEVEKDRNLINGFTCADHLSVSSDTMTVLASVTADIQNTLGILSLWILPAVYGALGSIVFYMRAVLNPLLPDPSLAQMVHRISLGGFAGIIFAWFWAPSPDTAANFAGLTVNAFAIAFLIGFSLDVFFAGLDRLVGALGGAISPNLNAAGSLSLRDSGGSAFADAAARKAAQDAKDAAAKAQKDDADKKARTKAQQLVTDTAQQLTIATNEKDAADQASSEAKNAATRLATDITEAKSALAVAEMALQADPQSADLKSKVDTAKTMLQEAEDALEKNKERVVAFETALQEKQTALQIATKNADEAQAALKKITGGE